MMFTALRLPRRVASTAIVILALFAGACGGVRPEIDTELTAPEPTPQAPAPTSEPVATSVPTPVPPSTPTEVPRDPWEVVTITAETATGIAHPGDSAFRFIETFDEAYGKRVRFEQMVLNPTYFGSDLTLMVTDGDVGDPWVKVQLPVRPNGTEAWVNTEGFSFDTHRFHATVDLSAFNVQVFDGDDLVVETGAVIGANGTPTPVGRWFINDKLEGDKGVYGNWILSLSAFSETLVRFNGALPVIAIHGTNSPQQVGEAISNGCVRVPNDVIDLLADTLPLGTPVDIVV